MKNELLTGLLFLILVQTQYTNAATLSFSQDGFSDGSTVSGSFAGTNSNNDGWISTNEVTEATTTFIGGDEFLHDFTVISPQPPTIVSHAFDINYDLDGIIGMTLVSISSQLALMFFILICGVL
ncbi:MAG: hypothetical protein V3U75_02905 [Methylococcaceae bacterium]